MNRPLPKVLAIDDDQEWLSQIPLILKNQCEIHCCSSVDQGLFAIEENFYDLILLDLNFDADDRTGLDIFRRISATDRGADVIVISAETRFDRVVEVLNAGVTRFITKPTTPEKIRNEIDQTLQQREARLRAVQLVSGITGDGSSLLIGNSFIMQRLRLEIGRLVKNGVKDVLVLGETGSGKELVAKMIASQADPSQRFVPIHCGAISDGLAESELFGHVKGAFTGADRDRPSAFESASGGFVFFDEIGDMPVHQQVKLLRVLQERKVTRVGSRDQIPVNFRTISATHVDLEKAIIEGRFREDLYFRIARDRIKIPALREHVEDIPELVFYFLSRSKRKDKKTITPGALELLKAYHWPGNIRQLDSVVEVLDRVDGPTIREKDVCTVLPEVSRLASSRFTKSLVGRYGANLVQNERERFRKAIVEAGGDRNIAANKLGLSRATFFRKAKDLGLVQNRRTRRNGSEDQPVEAPSNV